MKLTILTVVAIAILVQGCALGSQRKIPVQAEREQIKIVDLYNLIIQDEVRPTMDIPAGAGADGGLIGSLAEVAAIRGFTIAAHNMVEPLYHATDSMDYRAIMAKEINSSVASLYSIKAEKSSAETKLLSDSQLKLRIQQLKDGEHLLYISSSYALVDDAKSFTTEMVAMLFKRPSESQSTALPAPIYANKFIYISPPVGNGNSDSISAWSKNNGELFKNILVESASEIAQQLKYDLQAPGQECGKLVPVAVFGYNSARRVINAVLIEQKPARALVRSSIDGAIYSIPRVFKPSVGKDQKCKQQEQIKG